MSASGPSGSLVIGKIKCADSNIYIKGVQAQGNKVLTIFFGLSSAYFTKGSDCVLKGGGV